MILCLFMLIMIHTLESVKENLQDAVASKNRKIISLVDHQQYVQQQFNPILDGVFRGSF